jgi:S1-C subfamily serine protease
VARKTTTLRRAWIAASLFMMSATATGGVDAGDGIPVRPEPLGPRIESVLRRATPSVVSLWYGKGRRSHVTGAIISPDGLVITCGHMSVMAGDAVEVALADGRRCEGKVLSKLTAEKDEVRDLGLVQIGGDGPWPAVELGTAADLGDRDQLIAVGFPNTALYGRRPEDAPCQVRLGHQYPKLREPAGVVPTSIRGLGGDSGGPLFDLGGRLVGTVSSNGGTGAHTLYVSVDLLRREWRELAGNRPLPPPPCERRPVATSAAEETASAVRAARDAVVEVRSDDRWTGFGVLVARGLVLTKASELGPNVSVVLRNDIPAFAELVATDRECDLALLRVPATDLTDAIKPIEWADVSDLPVGTPVAAVTTADFAPPTGIVSVSAHTIPGIRGGLAIRVGDAGGGVKVVGVVDELNKAWLRAEPQLLRRDDVILCVDGKPVVDRIAYQRRFGGEPGGPPRLIAGDLVKVTFRRADVTDEILTHLRPAYTITGQLLYPFSYRYTGFASAFACDFNARPEHCGAPVVDSSGRAVGLLVARAQHLESLVIPASAVKMSLRRMRPRAPIEP